MIVICSEGALRRPMIYDNHSIWGGAAKVFHSVGNPTFPAGQTSTPRKKRDQEEIGKGREYAIFHLPITFIPLSGSLFPLSWSLFPFPGTN